MLFACYTLLREKPVVVSVLDCGDERSKETLMAMVGLDLPRWLEWPISERYPDWKRVKELMVSLRESENITSVWLPLPEPGGQEDHNSVGEIGRLVFGDRCRFYATYRRGQGRTRTDNEVIPEPDWYATKFRAMSYYTSQINHPQMRPWFTTDWDREFVA